MSKFFIYKIYIRNIFILLVHCFIMTGISLSIRLSSLLCFLNDIVIRGEMKTIFSVQQITIFLY